MSSLTLATVALGTVVAVLAYYVISTRDHDMFRDVVTVPAAPADDLDEMPYGRPFPDPQVVHHLDVVNDHLGQSWACTCGLFFWPTGAPELALAWNRHKGLVAPNEEMAA